MSITISKVADYIQCNVGEITAAEDVAEHFDIPYETLRKRFRREMRIPLGSYLRLQRVEEMKRLLLTSDLCCYKICFRAGFRREDSGSKIFKQVTGKTMLEYKESLPTNSQKRTT